MCPVKTENLSRNVPREEGEFWRGLVAELRVRSRANLENFLLLEGLKAVNRQAAHRLQQIRAAANPRSLNSLAIIALALGFLICGLGLGVHKDLRRGRTVSRTPHVRNVRWEGAAGA